MSSKKSGVCLWARGTQATVPRPGASAALSSTWSAGPAGWGAAWHHASLAQPAEDMEEGSGGHHAPAACAHGVFKLGASKLGVGCVVCAFRDRARALPLVHSLADPPNMVRTPSNTSQISGTSRAGTRQTAGTVRDWP